MTHMGQHDAIGRIDIKRLSFCVSSASGGGVPDMTYAHAAHETCNALGIEYVPYHPVRFALIKSSFGPTGHHTTGILTTVLKEVEAFANIRCRLSLDISQD